MFFDVISIWVKFIEKTPTDLFVKYFCEFFDTPGVPGGVFWSTGEILPSWLDVWSSFEVLTTGCTPTFARIKSGFLSTLIWDTWVSDMPLLNPVGGLVTMPSKLDKILEIQQNLIPSSAGFAVGGNVIIWFRSDIHPQRKPTELQLQTH